MVYGTTVSLNSVDQLLNSVKNRSLEVKSCRNATLLNSLNSRTLMLRYFNNNNNNNMPLLCYVVKRFLHILPVLMFRWLTASQTGAQATG
jgi:hypothetical protein